MVTQIEREEAIKVLRKFGSVLRDSTAIDKPVIEVDLSGSQATDEIVGRLRYIPELQRLHLDRNPISNRSLDVLEYLPSLHALNLEDTPLTDAALLNLKFVPELRSLLLGSEVTNHGLLFLRLVPKLETLSLSMPGIDEESFKIISSLQMLRSLTFFCKNITHSDIRHLTSIKSLTNIFVRCHPEDVRLGVVDRLRQELPFCTIEH